MSRVPHEPPDALPSASAPTTAPTQAPAPTLAGASASVFAGFALHPVLAAASRFAAWPRVGAAPTPATLEVAVLLAAGAAAALASALVKMRLGIPGHHVLLALPPIAAGIALVPRRRAGAVMALGAGGALCALSLAGARPLGPGALASTLAAGPLLDLALARVREGRHVLLAFTLAGLATNVVAYGVRALTKALGWGGLGGGRRLGAWWVEALVTYPACGLAAGFLVGLVLFRSRADRASG